jgi:hypothetical protein
MTFPANKQSRKTTNYCIVSLAMLLFIYITQAPTSIAVPPRLITKQSGNVKVEVRQISVEVIGRGSSGKPTGWGAFKEYTDLALVKFQIRIFRNGKLKTSENIGSYSYRGGELPELIEIRNIDTDRELEARFLFRNYDGAAKYRVLVEHIYDWNPSANKYERKTNVTSPGEF